MGDWSAEETLQIEQYTFIDYYQNKVELSFSKNPYSDYPKHVWIITTYHDQWLLTKHSDRGLEFPGGKVELGETPEEAAYREVYEETGGKITKLTYLGQYKVTAKSEIVIKNIYYAEVSHIEKQEHYFETDGPKLIKELPKNIKLDTNYSFIMKDNVLFYSLRKIFEMKEVDQQG